MVFEVQVEKTCRTSTTGSTHLPNSTVRNGMPSLFQVKAGSVVSYSGTVSQPWSTITDIYIHKQMSEQELAEMIEKEQPRQDRGGAAPMRTRQKGFTLLEMGGGSGGDRHPSGIAIPSYQNYVIRPTAPRGRRFSDAGRAPGTLPLQNPVGRLHQGRGCWHEFGQLAEQPVQLTIATPTSTTYTPDRHADQLADPRDKTCGKLTSISSANGAQPARPATTAPSTTVKLNERAPYERGSSLRTVHKA